MKHAFVVAILVIICTILVYAGLVSVGLLPEQASVQAITIDQLFNIHLWLISFLFSLIIVIMVYSLVVFRRKKGETGDGAHIEGSTSLEIIWTLIPLGVVIFLAYIGAMSLGEVQRVDPSALVVKVNSGQWFWQYQYPEFGITSTELYLPQNRQVKLEMTSQDVIHSFWVPEFRVKQDLVPGRITTLRITPSKTGEYVVRCAELCGASHAYMEGKVYVVTQEEFDQWVIEQQSAAPIDPVLRGEQLASQYGCLNCHSIDGSAKLGPTWKGLADEEVELSDGVKVIADTEYLRRSIVDPNYEVVAGYSANVMPSFAEILDRTQIESLVAYIQSLK